MLTQKSILSIVDVFCNIMNFLNFLIMNIFIDDALLFSCGLLGFLYLCGAFFIYSKQIVPGYVGMRRFRKIRRWHKFFSAPLLCLFTVYAFTPWSSFGNFEKIAALITVFFALAGFFILRYVVDRALLSLDGQRVAIEIDFADEKDVLYRIVYKGKDMEHVNSPRYCWEGYDLKSGDVLWTRVEASVVDGEVCLKLKFSGHGYN